MKQLCSLFVLLAAATLLSCSHKNPEQASVTAPAILLSDIHFNPFSDPSLASQLISAPASQWDAIFASSGDKKISTYGQETNYLVLKSALAEMKKVSPEPIAVIISGDFLPHHFDKSFAEMSKNSSPANYQDFVNKTIQFLALSLQKEFPQSLILPALGNNDSACGDYMSQPRSAFLQNFAQSWAPGQHQDETAANLFLKQFPDEGHYTAEISFNKARLRVIVLNGTVFSSHYQNKCGSASDDPRGDEMTWLKSQLQESRALGLKVWLVNHVPAGVDLHSSLNKNPQPCLKKEFVWMYDSKTNDEYLNVLNDYQDVIRLAIQGHTHMNDFRLYGKGKKVFPGLIVPALSPIFANNPGFEVVQVNLHDFQLEDSTVYKLDLNKDRNPSETWSLSSDFRQEYQLPDMSSASMLHLNELLRTQTDLKNKFFKHFTTDSGSHSLVLENEEAFFCTQNHMSKAGFIECYCHQ